MTNTALGAENSNSRIITFKSKEHEKFYMEYLEKCRYQDVYHQALVYCLGIDRDTRENVNKIYNFKTGCVKTESLQEGWQTSGSLRIVRMAFNLYCNGTPSVGDYEAEDGNIKSFERVAKKYSIDFSLKKDTTAKPPRYFVFFKARDADVMTAAFKEYTGKSLNKTKKPSVRAKLKDAITQAKDKNREREKTKQKEKEPTL